MKNLLIIILLTLAVHVSAQEQKQIDSLSFCKHKYLLPAGCKAESEYQLECDEYSMQWLYMNDAMLKTMPDHVVAQLQEQMRNFTKEPITPSLLDNKVMGYKVSYRVNNVTLYQIIAYGVVNAQPVLLQLTLKKDPLTNNSLPEFVRQIVKLGK
ncbi:MAG: hypothetical protein NT126_03560 [Bacteroidetes bacterium]|nr:hypothetical protein [Bacteroidota bacterium]